LVVVVMVCGGGAREGGVVVDVRVPFVNPFYQKIKEDQTENPNTLIISTFGWYVRVRGRESPKTMRI
jgi:hypothetical protein